MIPWPIKTPTNEGFICKISPGHCFGALILLQWHHITIRQIFRPKNVSVLRLGTSWSNMAIGITSLAL